MCKEKNIVDPFLVNVPIVYRLKTPQKQSFFDVFRRYKIETLAKNGILKQLLRNMSIYYNINTRVKFIVSVSKVTSATKLFFAIK